MLEKSWETMEKKSQSPEPLWVRFVSFWSLLCLVCLRSRVSLRFLPVWPFCHFPVDNFLPDSDEFAFVCVKLFTRSVPACLLDSYLLSLLYCLCIASLDLPSALAVGLFIIPRTTENKWVDSDERVTDETGLSFLFRTLATSQSSVWCQVLSLP